MKLSRLTVALFVVSLSAIHRASPAQGEVSSTAQAVTAVSTTLYHPDPDHPWNTLHAALSMDIKQLLEEPQRTRVVRQLNHFAEQHASAIDDVSSRAVLQHDLWRLFDRSRVVPGAYQQGSAPFRRGLVAAMRSLALSPEEVQRIRDPYLEAVSAKIYPKTPGTEDAPFLPPRLFDPEGPWVCISSGSEPPAEMHTLQEDGRSLFLVFLRFPGGRENTLSYLNALNLYPKPLVLNDHPIGTRYLAEGIQQPVRMDLFRLNPDTPQFPVGTQVALVQRLLVINQNGQPVPTPLTESVQIRVYDRIKRFTNSLPNSESPPQRFYEFELQRPSYLNLQPDGLRAVEPGFLAMDHAGRPTQVNCMGCHMAPGIHSFNTYHFGARSLTGSPPELHSVTTGNAAGTAVHWKKKQASFGHLQGVWEAADSR